MLEMIFDNVWSVVLPVVVPLVVAFVGTKIPTARLGISDKLVEESIYWVADKIEQVIKEQISKGVDEKTAKTLAKNIDKTSEAVKYVDENTPLRVNRSKLDKRIRAKVRKLSSEGLL